MEKVHQQCAGWSIQYGPVLLLKVFHKDVIVISSPEMIKEAMLGTRGKDFAGRPEMLRAMISQYGQMDLAFQSYTPQVERLRHIVHTALTKGPGGVGLKALEKVVKQELREIIQVLGSERRPFDPRKDISTYLINIMATIIFGHRFDKDSVELEKLFRMNRLYVDTYNPARGSELEIFPWLKYFGHPVYKDLLKAIDLRYEILETLIDEHAKTADISSPTCLLDSLLREVKLDRVDPPRRGEPITFITVQATILDLIIGGVVCKRGYFLTGRRVRKEIREC
jgi:steroid 17alpha-monooxygenase/17alpha-hydroxyprogesterone aldolase